jgi:flagellar hook-associated protein 1
MPNISGLYTALSGMNAQRRVLDVTAHNIANQSTPGYHRQRVELQPAGTAGVAAVFAGKSSGVGGVDAVGVTRIVDQLAEDRLVREGARLAGAQRSASDLARIEAAFPEPSEDGIAAVLDDFWAGWSDLSSLPTDLAGRTQALERGQSLVDSLHRAAADLDQVEATARDAVVALSAEVNDIADRIAQLNSAIAGSGDAANDLVDQRDLALRELAELTGAVARPSAGGQIDVSIGGRTLVSGTIVQRVDGTGGELRWAGDGNPVAAPAGRAASLAQTINDVVPRYRASLDDVAATLVADVNALHSVGYDQNGATGWNFFDPAGVTASTISLSADVAGQPERLAAGAPVLPGPVAPGPFDGEQARAIAGLMNQVGGAGDRYRSMVTSLGVEVRSAERRETIQTDVARAAEADAESVGGVSLDEEMATLMASQRAYEASARVLTTIDQLLGTLIERTGVVGR